MFSRYTWQASAALIKKLRDIHDSCGGTDPVNLPEIMDYLGEVETVMKNELGTVAFTNPAAQQFEHFQKIDLLHNPTLLFLRLVSHRRVLSATDGYAVDFGKDEP